MSQRPEDFEIKTEEDAIAFAHAEADKIRARMQELLGEGYSTSDTQSEKPQRPLTQEESAAVDAVSAKTNAAREAVDGAIGDNVHEIREVIFESHNYVPVEENAEDSIEEETPESVEECVVEVVEESDEVIVVIDDTASEEEIEIVEVVEICEVIAEENEDIPSEHDTAEQDISSLEEAIDIMEEIEDDDEDDDDDDDDDDEMQQDDEVESAPENNDGMVGEMEISEEITAPLFDTVDEELDNIQVIVPDDTDNDIAQQIEEIDVAEVDEPEPIVPMSHSRRSRRHGDNKATFIVASDLPDLIGEKEGNQISEAEDISAEVQEEISGESGEPTEDATNSFENMETAVLPKITLEEASEIVESDSDVREEEQASEPPADYVPEMTEENEECEVPIEMYDGVAEAYEQQREEQLEAEQEYYFECEHENELADEQARQADDLFDEEESTLHDSLDRTFDAIEMEYANGLHVISSENADVTEAFPVQMKLDLGLEFECSCDESAIDVVEDNDKEESEDEEIEVLPGQMEIDFSEEPENEEEPSEDDNKEQEGIAEVVKSDSDVSFIITSAISGDSGVKDNEDFIYNDHNAVILMDGATAVGGGKTMNPDWVTYRVCEYLPAMLEHREETMNALLEVRLENMPEEERDEYITSAIRSCVAGAINDTIDRLDVDYMLLDDDERSDYPPSSTMLLARAIGDKIAFVCIGDSTGVVYMNDGSELRLEKDSVLEYLDQEAIHYIKALAHYNDVTIAQAANTDAVQNMFAAHRIMMNTEDGYAVMAPKMKPFLEENVVVVDKKDVDHVLFYTDGFDHVASALERPGADFAEILEELRLLEKYDPDFTMCPRLKPGDDASAIAFDIC